LWAISKNIVDVMAEFESLGSSKHVIMSDFEGVLVKMVNSVRDH